MSLSRWIVIGALAWLLAACNSNAAVPTQTETAVNIPIEYDPADLTTTASGLQYVMLQVGEGETPVAGDQVNVHYTGWLEDGTEFDSSRSRNQPFSFTVGTGNVIAGWDEGLTLIAEGGRALFIIPPQLAYGEVARGAIPANATLYFEVELLGIERGPEGLGESDPVQIPVTFDPADVTTTASGLQYVILEAGDGPLPQATDTVRVHYTGWLKNGDQFDSSLERNQPIGFILGAGRVIPGWDEGIALLPVGTRALLIIPPDLAYGPEGRGPIPANAALYFEVEVVSAEPAPEPATVAESDYILTESGLKYVDLQVGDGAEATVGAIVSAHYTGWLDDGSKFDSSYDRGQPFQLQLGEGLIIPGWEEGLLGMRVGGVRQLIIPPELGYGAEGQPPVIPPNATLIFEVTMLEVETEAGP